MKIVLSPFSQKLRNGKENPKNYPTRYWKGLVDLLTPGNEIIQVGVEGEERLVNDVKFNLRMPELKQVINDMDFFISVDNFFPHMANHYGKWGMVIFGRSDPKIYGYRQNINILKDEKYLRPDQFGMWESCERMEDAFPGPQEIEKALLNLYNGNNRS